MYLKKKSELSIAKMEKENVTFCKSSIQSKTPSCKGVNRESDIVDIMYGVESLCTGTATAFIKTVHN